MRIIEARGPMVEALRRYDPGLRARWSWEKKTWAVDAPLKRHDSGWMLPPVRYEATPQGVIEHLMPELSDRYIEYHGRRYTVCWARHLDWRLYWAIVGRDSHRMQGGAAGEFVKRWKEREQAQRIKDAKLRSDRAEQAFDRLRFLNRTRPWADPIGGGISTKGMRLE